MTDIAANARLMQSPLTGQPRYFAEIIRRFKESPRSITPPRKLGSMRAHMWEQFTLPGMLGKQSLLWSPANTGPLSVTRQVVTIHDVSMCDHPEWFSKLFAAWYRFLVPRLARRVRHILTVSEFSKREIVRHCDVSPDKITVAPNAVDACFTRSTDEQIQQMRSRFSLQRPYVLVVGSVQPRKNLARLFKAWEKVRAPDVELVVAGGSFGVFSDAGLGEIPARTKLLGYVNEADLVALYSGAMAFCYPSLYEGFGMPPLEAMACGTPVVTSNNTALPEVVGDAALFVDPEDIESIAAGIQKIIDDESTRTDLREKGLRRSACFSWDETSRLVEQVLSHAAIS